MPLKTESERETLSLLERGHNSLAPTTPDDARPLDRRYETFEATSEHSSQPLPESEAGLRNVLKWSLGRDVKSEGREGHSSFRAMFSPGQSQRSETRSRYSVDQSPNSRRSLLAVDPSYAVAADVNGKNEWKEGSKEGKKPKLGSMPRPIGGFAKLGTFDGVFVPTSLNVLSILMFLRFGFILGQSGFLGMMGKFSKFNMVTVSLCVSDTTHPSSFCILLEDHEIQLSTKVTQFQTTKKPSICISHTMLCQLYSQNSD